MSSGLVFSIQLVDGDAVEGHSDAARHLALRDGLTVAMGHDSSRVARLHESTSGVLREIDRIAGGALREAARKKRRNVERDMIDRVLQIEGSSAAA